jgi:hypothetical protein
MSDYSIDDDEMDNNYSHDYDFTSSNFRFKKYFPDKQENNFEDDDSESFDKPITITMPPENIDKLQYESETKQMEF